MNKASVNDGRNCPLWNSWTRENTIISLIFKKQTFHFKALLCLSVCDSNEKPTTGHQILFKFHLQNSCRNTNFPGQAGLQHGGFGESRRAAWLGLRLHQRLSLLTLQWMTSSCWETSFHPATATHMAQNCSTWGKSSLRRRWRHSHTYF